MIIPGLGLTVGWRDLVDILLITMLLYQVILLIKGTGALTAIFGLLGLVLVHFLSGLFGFSTLNWLLDGFFNYLFLVVVIVFQRDIRAALASMGARQFFFRRSRGAEQVMLDEVVEAAAFMSQRKIGALMVIERGVALGDLTERGVLVHSKISKELLTTIFWPGSPLHDGAVIMKAGDLVAAGCILPLSFGLTGKKDYGTRHRAALGVTEESDAIAIVVSEERGSVRLAVGGRLSGSLDSAHLMRALRAAMERD